MLKWAFVLIFIGFLAACGQKGGLYMPEDPNQHKQDEKPKKVEKQQ